MRHLLLTITALLLMQGLFAQILLDSGRDFPRPGDSIIELHSDTLLFDPSIFDQYTYDTVYHGDTMLLMARMPASASDSLDTVMYAQDPLVKQAKEEEAPRIRVNYFEGDLTDFYHAGLSQHKILIYYFSAVWCGPCRETERSLFSNRDLADFINKNCLIKKIDVDSYEGIDAKDVMKVTELPTFVFYGREEISRFSGMTDEYFFRKQIENALPHRPN